MFGEAKIDFKRTETLRFVGLGGQSGISSATAKNPLGSAPVSKSLEAQKRAATSVRPFDEMAVDLIFLR